MASDGCLPEKQRMNQHITILVVDDDASLDHLTRLLLVQYGYGALHALSAEAAIQVSNRHPGQIDLLLADIAMAPTSGPRLAQDIRTTRPNIRLLFMSGLVPKRILKGSSAGTSFESPSVHRVSSKQSRRCYTPVRAKPNVSPLRFFLPIVL